MSEAIENVPMEKLLNPSQLSIEQIQEAIIKLGYQFNERIYNDGWSKNCFIEFTKDTSPSALSAGTRTTDTLGWGRFERRKAWEMAYDWIVLGKSE